ncbi:MAG: AbrB/MazE/SpoVT family DNA-binding domain-containing protein [Candidatus Schekmanbacteria bacterium]|nr:AbrB/MazE/SpoVT family DNA-binding domain-containing protein [Candidatus Schekmanbacteria bacterium]
MPSVKVGLRHQIIIPHNIFAELKLVAGDSFDLNLENEKIVLTPIKIAHKDKTWYSKKWQQAEKEADEAIARGEIVGPFDNIADALTALKKSKV